MSAGSCGSVVRLILKVSAAVALLTLFAPVITVLCRSSEDPATPKPAVVPLTGVKAPAPTLISNAEDGMLVVPTAGVSAAMALPKYAYSATAVCPGCRTQLVVTVIPAFPALLAFPGIKSFALAVDHVCVAPDKDTVNFVFTVADSATVAVFEFVAALAVVPERRAKAEMAAIRSNF